jgi:uncharacterized protein YbaP (TraB family)
LLFNSKDYDETKKRILKVNTVIQYIIDSYLSNDQDMISSIDKTKATFHNEKFYNLIENGLANRRNGKMTFFDQFQGFLIETKESIKDSPPDDFWKK